MNETYVKVKGEWYYTLRILVFRVVGFLARLSHVCPIHSSNSTRCRLAEV